MTLVAHLGATDYVSCGMSGPVAPEIYSIRAFTCTDKTWQVAPTSDSFRNTLSTDGRLLVAHLRQDDSSLQLRYGNAAWFQSKRE